MTLLSYAVEIHRQSTLRLQKRRFSHFKKKMLSLLLLLLLLFYKLTTEMRVSLHPTLTSFSLQEVRGGGVWGGVAAHVLQEKWNRIISACSISDSPLCCLEHPHYLGQLGLIKWTSDRRLLVVNIISNFLFVATVCAALPL